MIKHGDIDLIGYLEGEKLPLASFEHIRSCPDCRREVDALETAIVLLSSYFQLTKIPEKMAPLPEKIKERLILLKKRSLSQRLSQVLTALKAGGKQRGQSIKELVDRAFLPSLSPAPVPAIPRGITAVRGKGTKKKAVRPSAKRKIRTKGKKMIGGR